MNPYKFVLTCVNKVSNTTLYDDFNSKTVPISHIHLIYDRFKV